MHLNSISNFRYVLWKKKWEAKGFGLTLKGDLDFDIKNFGTAEPETFETIYGPAGDGNIYNPENVSAYMRHVLSNTDNKGVHLMMADGGFTVEGHKHLQEVLSHQIILSQVFVALGVVRVGGHFVCKLFDTFTPFTVALIYFMYRSFDAVAIHKPRTSRPANSERYLVCKWKKAKEVTSPIMNYLADCHAQMWKHQNEGGSKTIVELFPISILDPFYTYVKLMNTRYMFCFCFLCVFDIFLVGSLYHK
jgi:cap1 methyltransferase